MFLHLREKIKFIRYNRYNRRSRFDSRKFSSQPTPPASRDFTHFPHSLYFTVPRRATRAPGQRDSTNFTDCSNFSQRNARRRSIKSLSGVASKKVDRMRLARRRRGSLRAFARFVSAIFANVRTVGRRPRFSPNLRRRPVASVGFRFKGESHGRAYFSRLLSPLDRFDGRSTFARLRSANANFRLVIHPIFKRSDFRAAKSMGG